MDFLIGWLQLASHWGCGADNPRAGATGEYNLEQVCLPSGTACKKEHLKLQWPIVLVAEPGLLSDSNAPEAGGSS